MEQRTKEWLEARKGVFTASNIWKLLGKSLNTETAKTYIREKAMEILGIEIPSFTTPAMQWGTDNEALAFRFAKRRLGIDFKEVGFQKDYDLNLGGSADGISENHALEIKCPFNTSEHIKHKLEIKNGETLFIHKPEYYYQLQCNMMVYQKNKGYFVSFDPRLDKNLGWHAVEIEDHVGTQVLIQERVKQATLILNEYLNLLNPNT